MEKLTKREKVMIGVGVGLSVAGFGLAGYFGVKYYKTNGDIKILKQGMDHLLEDNNDLLEKVELLTEAFNEVGVEEVIDTITDIVED